MDEEMCQPEQKKIGHPPQGGSGLTTIPQGAIAGKKLRGILIEQLNAIDRIKNNLLIIVKRLDELDGYLSQLKYHQQILWIDAIIEYIRIKLDEALTDKRQLDDPSLICACKSPNLICQIHDRSERL